MHRRRLSGSLLEAGSLPDVIMTRYDSPTAGMLAAIAMELGVMSYLATQTGYTVTALLWIALVLAMRALVVSGAIKAFGITIPLNIDSGAVALLVSIVLFVSVSLFGSRPNTSLSVGSHSDKWAE